MSPKPATKSAPKSSARVVVHPKVSVKLFTGEDALTADKAKQLLGWTEEPDGAKWGTEYLLKDGNGKKIRCENNVTNRPLYSGVYEALKQDMLNKRWRLNGETAIIGSTGLILNNQHTLIALVLAEQERSGKNAEHWKKVWPKPVAIDKLIVFGIDESDDTVNTMDTCKPRSLADVIYRSEFFKTMRNSDRRVISRMTDHAVRILWHRTGAHHDAFSPRRTHAEALDFLARHPSLLKAIKHIHAENTEGKINTFVPPGYASGLLYLMGVSGSGDEALEAYEADPAEKQLDIALFDKACSFWVLLTSQDKSMAPVRKALGDLMVDGYGGSLSEKTAIIAKAWHHYAHGRKLTEELLELEYTEDADGVRHLTDVATFGGIDKGQPKRGDDGTDDPTPEEIAERAAAVRRANGDAPASDTPQPVAKAAPQPKPQPKPATAQPAAAAAAPGKPTKKPVPKPTE